MTAVATARRVIWREPAPLSPEQRSLTGWPLMSAILARRGITSADEARRFLDPLHQAFGNPLLLPDLERAVALIRRVIQDGGTIGIFGDYDVDGLSSTAMLARVLRKLGSDPEIIIPHRMRDGYGLSLDAVARFAQAGVSLLITVDTGSGSRPEIEAALQRGLDVIVLDHHQLHGSLPEAVPFVTPRRPENRYPEENLAAVGVVFTLTRALLGEREAEMYLPYVALGTVADVVNLHGENRVLAAKGIEALRRWKLPGMNALCAVAGVNKREIGSFEIGYIIGPRINAAGRMDTPLAALEWFLANDPEAAGPLAERLDDLNRARQQETQRILEEAILQVELRGPIEQTPAIVVDDPGWSIGIAGIVAGKLVERFHRPAVVIERGGMVSKGSARSPLTINVVEAIGMSADLLERYGGHAAAAGLTLASEHIERFRAEFMANVFDLAGGRLPDPVIELDAEVPHAELTLETVDRLDVLEPTGQGNRPPLFLVKNLVPRQPRLSRDGRHLFFDAVDELGRRHKAIFFGAGERLAELGAAGRVDLATSLRRDTWNGLTRMSLQLSDFRATADAPRQTTFGVR
jgi:single-stranded-DNA-specific exonuclease